MTDKKERGSNPAIEKLAGTIAGHIIRWRFYLADNLNSSFNCHTRKVKQWILVLFCLISTGALVLCLMAHPDQLGLTKKGLNMYPAGHIGLPSKGQCGQSRTNRFYNSSKIIK